jgi:hypothetical protein
MVDGNAVKPGFKLAFSIEGFQMRHNFDQHRLGSIEGIVGMGKYAQQNGVQTPQCIYTIAQLIHFSDLVSRGNIDLYRFYNLLFS